MRRTGPRAHRSSRYHTPAQRGSISCLQCDPGCPTIVPHHGLLSGFRRTKAASVLYTYGDVIRNLPWITSKYNTSQVTMRLFPLRTRKKSCQGQTQGSGYEECPKTSSKCCCSYDSFCDVTTYAHVAFCNINHHARMV